MTRFRTAALSAVLTTGLILPAVPTSSAAGTSRALAPTSIAKRVVKVDVDGDSRKDTVTITRTGTTKFKVSVKTASGKKASRTVTSTFANDWGLEPWRGAAKLDKVKGYELLLATGGGDGYTSVVLTWRKGALLRQAAPKARTTKYGWYVASTPQYRYGFRFYTSKGVRYVQQYGLHKDPGATRWKGTVTTSKWAGSWKKTSATKVSLTTTKAKKYPGDFTGVKIVAKP